MEEGRHSSPPAWLAARAEQDPLEVAALEMLAVLQQSVSIMGLAVAAAERVAMGAAVAVSVAVAALVEMHLSCSTTKLTDLRP